MNKFIRFSLVFSIAMCAILPHAFAAELNVYSARKEALIKPALDKFTAQTGIKVNLLTGKADALISRIKSEGSLTQADLLLTTDVGRLHRAKSLGLTQSTSSDNLTKSIPSNLRDSENHWFSLTLRARPIVYSAKTVQPSELSTMDALSTTQWKGRVCIRSSNNIYNQSMVAAMIEQLGVDKTQAWANGFVQSFAQPPKGGDRDQVKAVAAGRCDIAIANTYYIARMLQDAEQRKLLQDNQIKVFWPNQDDRGAHINVSGAAVTKHAQNPQAAKQLIEFLMTPAMQAWYAEVNHEYPVLEGVEWSQVLQSFGQFKGENIQLSRVGELNAQAVRLMDKAGWK